MNSGKRKHSAAGENDVIVKKLRKDVNDIIDEDFKCNGDVQESTQDLPDKLHDIHETSHYKPFPHQLIRFMYKLDLSILCSFREHIYAHKYPSLSLSFGDSEINKFNDIIIHFKAKPIYIQVEYEDDYYVSNGITYAQLFIKQRFSIKNYFNSFVKHLISNGLLNKIKYLIVFTNLNLDLTKEKVLKQGRIKNFYPFKFTNINIEEYHILKDFLYINDIEGNNFYQFSQDETTRSELSKRLEFSSTTHKIIKEGNFPQDKIKEKFMDKLIFVVNQPNRERLNSIVKSEIKQSNDGCISPKEMRDFSFKSPKTVKRANQKHTSQIVYGFSLLKSFLHTVFLHENMLYMRLENRSVVNDFTINYRNRITYLKVHKAEHVICYDQLFPSSQKERKNMLSINKFFTCFVEESKRDLRYFIVYTNAGLDLTEEKMLKKTQSNNFYPLQFDSIDVQKKRYKLLRDCPFLNKNGLYQFSQEKETIEVLLRLLNFPTFVSKKGKTEFYESEEEIKNFFLNKLIFAVNQPNDEEINELIKNHIDNSNVPYDYEELYEIALRWSESHEFGNATEKVMEKLLEDIKNNKFYYPKTQNNIEKIIFAKSVVGNEGTLSFYEFLDFLTVGDGMKYLEVLKRNEIKLSNVSSILYGAGGNAIKAFKNLYDLWFDDEENKMQYLKTLEKEDINLSNMSNILSKAGINGAKAFKDLYDFWFDGKGRKTEYLKVLEKNEINLSNVSSILSRTGINAVKAFKDLYNLWFLEGGSKTEYLKNLQKEGIKLSNISSILSGAQANAAKAFKDLYDLWFDEDGNKTKYLKNFEEEGISLSNISSILNGARADAAKVFKDLYDLWFDEKGEKTQYLKTLEGEGMSLSNMSSILNGARTNSPKAFISLYNIWFDQDGNKTKYLKTLKDRGVSLSNMSNILCGAGANAKRAFKDLYDLWFNEVNKTDYLSILEREGISLSSVSNILSRAGINAAKAFKDLYYLWFDKDGNKTHYLVTLEKEGISLSNMSSILSRAGTNAAKAFKELYDLLFDENGNKTQYLKVLENDGTDLSNVFSILSKAGANAVKAFRELYHTFYDEQGHKKQHLEHFIGKNNGKKVFTTRNLSSILSGAGIKTKDAFEKLHNLCFTDKGKRTELLDDFYDAGFKPSNLSCILCGTGVHAASVLNKLHGICFDDKREKQKLLDDFCNLGFKPKDLCNLFSGAVNSIENFYYFCCIGEAKKYLYHFLKEQSFKPSHLCNILHGARANVCCVFKDFHNVCFDEDGNKTQLLADFHKLNFKSKYLAIVLSMAGSNASSILTNFHKSCFNKNNYLQHFLDIEELFVPKSLSRILRRAGTNICPIFEKLHDLCFDKAGNKTKYLRKLIKNDPYEIHDVLYRRVRGN